MAGGAVVVFAVAFFTAVFGFSTSFAVAAEDAAAAGALGFAAEVFLVVAAVPVFLDAVDFALVDVVFTLVVVVFVLVAVDFALVAADLVLAFALGALFTEEALLF